MQKLSLNVVKTQSLIIGSCANTRKVESQPDAQASSSISGQDIEIITNKWYLGVQIDSQLNWEKHIDTIKTKAKALDSLYIVRNIFHLTYSTKNVERNCLAQLNLLFFPFMCCCSEFKIYVLQNIQKRAARIVTSNPYDAPAGPII